MTPSDESVNVAPVRVRTSGPRFTARSVTATDRVHPIGLHSFRALRADVNGMTTAIGSTRLRPTMTAGGGSAGDLPLHAIRSAFQPVVDLDTFAVVGYEALARGPVGTVWERPDVLFEAGRTSG